MYSVIRHNEDIYERDHTSSPCSQQHSRYHISSSQSIDKTTAKNALQGDTIFSHNLHQLAHDSHTTTPATPRDSAQHYWLQYHTIICCHIVNVQFRHFSQNLIRPPLSTLSNFHPNEKGDQVTSDQLFSIPSRIYIFFLATRGSSRVYFLFSHSNKKEVVTGHWSPSHLIKKRRKVIGGTLCFKWKKSNFFIKNKVVTTCHPTGHPTPPSTLSLHRRCRWHHPLSSFSSILNLLLLLSPHLLLFSNNNKKNNDNQSIETTSRYNSNILI